MSGSCFWFTCLTEGRAQLETCHSVSVLQSDYEEGFAALPAISPKFTFTLTFSCVSLAVHPHFLEVAQALRALTVLSQAEDLQPIVIRHWRMSSLC